MKAVRLAELRALLASEDFQSFWGRLKAARAAHADAGDQYDELLTQATMTDFRAELAQKNGIDTLYLAGEAEDLAARLFVESSELENKGLDLVGAFEDQRFVASDWWYKLNACERTLEERRDSLAAAAAKDPKSPAVAKLEADIARLQREHAELKENYGREDKKKIALWDQVESMWARSAELSLIVAEKKLEAKKIKRRAEALFHQAEERKARAKALRDDAERLSAKKSETRRASDTILSDLLPKFGGVAVGDFLYFRSRESQKAAYAVALVADSDTYNVEVSELGVYQVDRVRGVAFLEPAVEMQLSQEEADRRFEEYFLHGRKGRVKEEPGTSPASAAG